MSDPSALYLKKPVYRFGIMAKSTARYALFALLVSLLWLCEAKPTHACAVMRSDHGLFKAGQEPFGFVVPTPSRPTVTALKGSPFAELDAHFPFAQPARTPA